MRKSRKPYWFFFAPPTLKGEKMDKKQILVVVCSGLFLVCLFQKAVQGKIVTVGDGSFLGNILPIIGLFVIGLGVIFMICLLFSHFWEVWKNIWGRGN